MKWRKDMKSENVTNTTATINLTNNKICLKNWIYQDSSRNSDKRYIQLL